MWAGRYRQTHGQRGNSHNSLIRPVGVLGRGWSPPHPPILAGMDFEPILNVLAFDVHPTVRTSHSH